MKYPHLKPWPSSTTRRFLLVAALFSLAHSSAFAETFSFEGFHLGMPRADATKVHPEISWQPVTQETPSGVSRKEFASHYLGSEASVSIGLDQAGQFVSLVGFTFNSPSDSQCILDAVDMRMRLERLYGPAAETVSESFGKRARWNADDGVTIRWAEACFVGTKEYFVTYAKHAG